MLTLLLGPRERRGVLSLLMFSVIAQESQGSRAYSDISKRAGVEDEQKSCSSGRYSTHQLGQLSNSNTMI